MFSRLSEGLSCKFFFPKGGKLDLKLCSIPTSCVDHPIQAGTEFSLEESLKIQTKALDYTGEY